MTVTTEQLKTVNEAAEDQAWDKWNGLSHEDALPTSEPTIMDGDKPAATAGQVVEAEYYNSREAVVPSEPVAEPTPAQPEPKVLTKV